MGLDGTLLSREKRALGWERAPSAFVTFLLASFFLVPPAQAQTGGIAGTVVSADDGVALEGANVWVAGTGLGAITSVEGRFTMVSVSTGSHFLKVNLIGYEGATVEVVVQSGVTSTLEISLSTHPVPMDAISVTGSRQLEKVTDAPVSLSVVSGQELARSTAMTYAEGLQKARGVDSYRGGADNVVLNARGFTTAYNYRFRVLVDNRSAMMPAAGVPAGAFYPVAREDIERMEAVLGPSSALYGPNAHNGLLHIITKHPRSYPGTTFVAGGGSNSILTGRVRHANAFERFAYKINVEYLTGKDWIKNDTVAVDNSGRVYMENPEDNFESLRSTATVYYFPSTELQVVASAGYTRVTTAITSAFGRIQGVDATLDYQQLRIETPRLFAQAYRTGNSFGDTHMISNKVAAMVAAANSGTPITEADAIAGVRAIDESDRLNYEVQYNDRFALGDADFRWVAGVQHEDTRPNSEGTFYTDGRVNIGDPVTGGLRLRQTGVYGQVEAGLGEHWKFVLAGRYDTHSRYESQTSPRVALVFRIPERGSFRLTYNRAFQAPEVMQLELLAPIGALPGTEIPLVLYGNGAGFTLSDGTLIPPLSPERNTTVEAGYRGLLVPRLYVDLNVYRSKYQNFISPTVGITDPVTGVYPVRIGEHSINPWPDQYVLTYRNFGRVTLFGVDFGVTYELSDRVDGWANYSHMNLRDLEDPANDFDSDGKFEELSFNSPENKAALGLGIDDLVIPGLYAAISGRWVEEYDFISGINRATKAGKGIGSFLFKDRGPLGGFTTFDVNLSYTVNSAIQLTLSATNVFDKRLRETVASPEIRRLVLTEFKYTVR